MDGERYQTCLCETLEGLPAVTFVMVLRAGVIISRPSHRAGHLTSSSLCGTPSQPHNEPY